MRLYLISFARFLLFAALLAGCGLERPTVNGTRTCVSCHEADRSRAEFPNHLAPDYPTTCQQCHTQHEWKPATFQHTKLPLVGAHSRTDCKSCHAKEPVPKTCVGCHDKDRARGPGHTKPEFSTQCQNCHSVEAWKPAVTDHSKFPFEGGHSNVACITCHPDASQPDKPKGTRCNDCHAKDRKAGMDPDHLATGFPDTCQQCHTVYSWKSATFSHEKLELVGRHKTTPCTSCHTDPNDRQKAKGTTCAECHGSERPKGATAVRPDHYAATFPMQCQLCHSANGWKPAAADHSKFPLSGKHSGVDCASCHVDPAQPKVPKAKTCVGCHDAERKKPKLPDHLAATFSTDCGRCHSTSGWKPASYDHSQRFPINGGHVGVACASCHDTTPVKKTCAGCHTKDVPQGATASRPDHQASGFSGVCSNCHSTASWTPASFDHSKFPLTDAHAGPTCAACHTDSANPSVPKGKTCAECHLADRPPAGSVPDHRLSGFPTKCDDCHKTTAWKSATFDHSSYLPLVGKHATTACSTCHNDPLDPTKAKGKSCADCHAADRPTGSTTSRPDHYATSFPMSCQTCHSANGWKPAAADHAKFPLTGAHAGLDCAGCHTDPNNPKVAKATTCVGCHDADRKTPKLPDHLASGFSTDCKACHTTVAWKPGTFDHGQTFPLTGGHSGVGCQSCHASEPVPKTCVGCHQGNIPSGATTTRPDHNSSGFSTACNTCHNIASWTPAAYDHSKFPLTGGHAGPACGACHTDPNNPSVPLGTTCTACHLSDRPPAGTVPDHRLAGFPTTCQDCHSTTGWKVSTFDHSTYLPLVGKHATTPCSTCHNDPLNPKKAKGTTCADCHAADRPTGATTSRPDHYAQSFPMTCQTCHSAIGWKPASADHSKFPLDGKHAGLDCINCHTDPNNPKVAKATTCVGCHDGDRSTPTIPNHLAVGFSTDCRSCHSTTGWKPAAFDHGQTFPLTGGHSGVGCASCHASEPVPKTCVGCHQSKIPTGATTTRPDHNSAGFSTTCSDCHSTVAWTPASFDHTKFPLTNGHAAPPCASCHTDPNNPSVPKGTTCTQCHLVDRPPAGWDPDHRIASFPTTCQDCHTTSVWTGATFDHSLYLPLVGKHATVLCAQCHTKVPMPTLCEGCHSAPATGHLGNPTGCDDCHTVNGWTPAAVDHSKFPLTGKHATLLCNQCHTDPNNPKVPTATTCVGCHNADRSTPTIPNHLTSGFPTDCASCHTTNGWKPASFTHTFPIYSGKHANLTCSTCHLDATNLKNFSCLGTCHKHSQSAMDSRHNGRKGYISGDFQHCINCHPNGR